MRCCCKATELTEVALENSQPKTTKAALGEIHRQIDHARINVSHADTKAALLAAGAIPITALLLAAPSLTEPSGSASVVSWVATSLMLLGIGFLGSVVWPRLSGRTGIRAGARRSPGHIIDLTLRLTADSDQRLLRAAEELSLLASLALTKFRRLQAAIVCFGVAAVFLVLGGVL